MSVVNATGPTAAIVAVAVNGAATQTTSRLVQPFRNQYWEGSCDYSLFKHGRDRSAE